MAEDGSIIPVGIDELGVRALLREAGSAASVVEPGLSRTPSAINHTPFGGPWRVIALEKPHIVNSGR